jgi:BCD family chlorophyll transporter-like MFS transporter
VVAAVSFGLLLSPFSEVRLVQVVQGAGALTIILNGAALWKQEPRNRNRTKSVLPSVTFAESWRAYTRTGQSARRLLSIGMGTVAFSMQDVLLEPYGGRVLHLPVSATTSLTAFLAVGGGLGLGLAAYKLKGGSNPYTVAALGALAGIGAFACLLGAPLLSAPGIFAVGVLIVGFGAGMFAHGTLTASMNMAQGDATGIALGAWGAVQATAAGLAIATGGVLSDAIGALARSGRLGPALAGPATGYSAVYLIEAVLLLATVLTVMPLARKDPAKSAAAENPVAEIAGATL